MRNTVRLGISSPELIASHGLSWVLRRQLIRCSDWPKMGEAVYVITAPSGFARKLLTYRDFHLYAADGNLLAAAVSEWLLIDLESRRPRPIPPHIASLETDLAPAAAHLDHPAGKVPPPATPESTFATRVAFSQLDFNDHLTNPVFPELMLEPLGADFLRHHLPRTIDISFQQEARYGDVLEAIMAAAEDGYRHALLRDGQTLATMATSWVPTTKSSRET